MPNSTKATRARKTTKQVTVTNPEERQQMIAVAAYYLAEQHNFKRERQLHDWLEAEAKINHAYGPAISE